LRLHVIAGEELEYVRREAEDLARAHGMELAGVEEADIILILGWDRDILDAVQSLGETGKPILGVSPRASEGILASTTIDELGAALEAILGGGYEIAQYMRLRGVVDGRRTIYALNEIAVFPSRSASLMSYELLIDGELMWRDRADGVLVATPFGSTAYALSAGGAVVLEESEVLEVVPVNSLDPSKKPLIVPSSSKIEVRGFVSRYPCEAVADGGSRTRVRRSLLISKSEKPVKLIRIASRPSVRMTLRARLLKELADMPPSAKFVLKMLEMKGPMSAKELAKATLLPERTVRHALSELARSGLIRKTVNLRDAKQVYYEAVTASRHRPAGKNVGG